MVENYKKDKFKLLLGELYELVKKCEEIVDDFSKRSMKEYRRRLKLGKEMEEYLKLIIEPLTDIKERKKLIKELVFEIKGYEELIKLRKDLLKRNEELVKEVEELVKELERFRKEID